MIVIFSDFGSQDIYLGQVKAVLNKLAANIAVIDLLNDVPRYNIRAAAHLLAALQSQFLAGTVFLCVVDPGVGGARTPIVANVGDKWFVGPDNGLLSVVAAKMGKAEVWEIVWKSERCSNTFHGRDLFAPIVAQIAGGKVPYEKLKQISGLTEVLDPNAINEIIYIDHYGNVLTGIPATTVSRNTRIQIRDQTISYAKTYSEVNHGEVFWYENSIGLVEIAANLMSAAETLSLRVGESVEILT